MLKEKNRKMWSPKVVLRTYYYFEAFPHFNFQIKLFLAKYAFPSQDNSYDVGIQDNDNNGNSKE